MGDFSFYSNVKNHNCNTPKIFLDFKLKDLPALALLEPHVTSAIEFETEDFAVCKASFPYPSLVCRKSMLCRLEKERTKRSFSVGKVFTLRCRKNFSSHRSVKLLIQKRNTSTKSWAMSAFSTATKWSSWSVQWNHVFLRTILVQLCFSSVQVIYSACNPLEPGQSSCLKTQWKSQDRAKLWKILVLGKPKELLEDFWVTVLEDFY